MKTLIHGSGSIVRWVALRMRQAEMEAPFLDARLENVPKTDIFS